MKAQKLIVPTILILAVCSIAKAQKPIDIVSCRGCSPSSAGPRQQVDFLEKRAKEVADHQRWPTSPRLPGKSQFARFTANFDFMNDTDKKIAQVVWECTLVNPTTRETIAKYTLITSKGIPPHRSAVLKESIMVPLAPFYPKAASTSQPKQSKSELPTVVPAEQINQVKEIRYKDGTISTP